MRALAFALVLIGLGVAGCTSSDTQSSISDRTTSPVSGTPASSSPAAVAPSSGPTLVAGTVDADILDTTFDPALMTVEPGNSVVWTNRGLETHSVVSDDGGFSGSGAIGPGESFAFAFNAAGDYAFHCRYHPELTGTIRVR